MRERAYGLAAIDGILSQAQELTDIVQTEAQRLRTPHEATVAAALPML